MSYETRKRCNKIGSKNKENYFTFNNYNHFTILQQCSRIIVPSVEFVVLESPRIIYRRLEPLSFVTEKSRTRNPNPFLPDNDIKLERSGPANVLCHRSPMSGQYLRFLERSEELFTPLTSRVPRRKKLARPMAGCGIGR